MVRLEESCDFYYFACIRYSPPLLQRRASETDNRFGKRSTHQDMSQLPLLSPTQLTMRVNVHRRVCRRRSTRVSY